MKRTKTTATVVAIALALSSSAFAAAGKGREGKDGKDGRATRGEIAGKNETAGASKARAATTALIGDISNGMRIESLPALESLKLTAADIPVLNQKTADAYEKGLFGNQQARLFEELKTNAGKEEYKALYANIQVLAAKNMLTDSNLKWSESIDGKNIEINSMNFLSGEALAVAKGSSPKFIQFMARKTQLEKDGATTRVAITQALKELGISLKEFAEKCLK